MLFFAFISAMLSIAAAQSGLRGSKLVKGTKVEASSVNYWPNISSSFFDNDYWIASYINYYESATNNHPLGNVEYHCVQMGLDWSTQQRVPVSVHGTFGNLGYFSGTFFKHFNTNGSWHEAAVTSVEIDRWRFDQRSGAGILRYNDNLVISNHDSKWWPAGSSNRSSYSLNDWGFLVPCANCIPSESSNWSSQQWNEYAKKVCLWDPEASEWDPVSQDLSNMVYGEPGDAYVFTTAGVGPVDTKGQLVGAYEFDNGKGEKFLEKGHLGLHAISSYNTGARVIASTWNATEGPRGKPSGSFLAMLHPQTRPQQLGCDNIRDDCSWMRIRSE
jgi:hypothetical protein